jgi:uncharacterized repeat protein (TIGR03837 family)
MNRPTDPLRWAIFCRVIDNFGDVGVCWRLACDLAQRGHSVQLWLDDTTALAWLAPLGCPGVQVIAWTHPFPAQAADGQLADDAVVDVMVEAFGCGVAPEFIAMQASKTMASSLNDSKNTLQPVWVNLEYLSAERYVERCHALPSLQSSGPAAGWTQWFFYPGFTPLTGGLLREADLTTRQTQFNRAAWLSAQGLPTTGEKRVSLFCYEPAALPGLLAQLAQHGLQGEPVRLLVAAGRAEKAVKAAIETGFKHLINSKPLFCMPGLLSISYLPLLTQTEFDHLLWACDLNFVRGEDSLVRALWAGQPWVWHIYPQDDGAHHAKLQALLSTLDAPDTLQAFHRVWNEGHQGPLPCVDLVAWRPFAVSSRAELLRQSDLTSQLLSFVAAQKKPA